MRKITLKTTKNNEITCYIYDEVKTPKAVVQIVHGASEHLTRYEEFILFLNKHGYICIGGDILGHGESTHAEGNYIYFDKSEAFESIVLVKDYAKEKYKELPLYLLGHSMGSFLARKLLIDYPKTYLKAIISGTSSMPALLTGTAKFLTNLSIIFRGKKGISPLISNLGMDNLPKKMKKKGILNDDEMWITHDSKIAKYYKESPICGEPFTLAAYQGMFYWISYTSSKKNIKKSDPSTPLFFIAGADDPVSDFGKGVKATAEMYKKCGMNYVEFVIYDGMRHEVLNEIDRIKVYNDCLNFLVK